MAHILYSTVQLTKLKRACSLETELEVISTLLSKTCSKYLSERYRMLRHSLELVIFGATRKVHFFHILKKKKKVCFLLVLRSETVLMGSRWFVICAVIGTIMTRWSVICQCTVHKIPNNVLLIWYPWSDNGIIVLFKLVFSAVVFGLLFLDGEREDDERFFSPSIHSFPVELRADYDYATCRDEIVDSELPRQKSSP